MPVSDQIIVDLREVVSATRNDDAIASMNDAERLVFRVLPELLDEVERLRRDALRAWPMLPELLDEVERLRRDARRAWPIDAPQMHDPVLAKDFLALYQAARMVTSALQTSAPSIDVEGLGLHVVRLAPLYDDVRRTLAMVPVQAPPLPFVLRGAVPVPPGQPRRSEVDPSLFDEVDLTLAGPHRVRVMRLDGSVSVECDHTFKGPPVCAHCGKSIAALRAESIAESALLERPDIAVPVTLGPSLRPRIEALVATGRLGRELAHVVQTLFVLGMLDAEGQDPQSQVGDPMMHVSAEAVFVRFGLPHEAGDEAARQRAGILRRLFTDLAEWCDEGDPLRPALLAAIERLPRV